MLEEGCAEITIMKSTTAPIDFATCVLHDNEDGGCQRGHGVNQERAWRLPWRRAGGNKQTAESAAITTYPRARRLV